MSVLPLVKSLTQSAAAVGINAPDSPKRANPLRLFDVKALGDLVFEQVNHQVTQIGVIIPLYNYSNYIIECISSVAEQDARPLSVVVIDDCSVDGGGELAAQFLKSNSNIFAESRVVKHRRNQGLSMSRNSGIVWSQEPFLFMLDADNRIRPPALSRLLEALLSSQSKFAYSQRYLFGSRDEIGTADVWDPERFRLGGNYIDAMALIRRDALLSVGGYGVLADDHGWEDFDLWCSFAERGYRGVYLPELLCEYRVHDVSMRTRTDLHQRSLALEMALRHPALLSRGDVPPFVEICSPDVTG